MKIMSHASPFAQVPDWLSEKVKTTDLAILSPWTPQQAILEHPVSVASTFVWDFGLMRFQQVTGWFVSHCGWNSVQEGMTAGLPM